MYFQPAGMAQAVTLVVPDSLWDAFKSVLQRMRCLIRITSFNAILAEFKDPEAVRVCARLLDGSSAKALHIQSLIESSNLYG